MVDFQLLDAEAAPIDVTMMWRRDRVLMHPQIKLAHEPQRAPDEVGRVTAVIGQNGTGKTHLLASIIDCMLAIENASKGRPGGDRQLPLRRLSYNVSDRTVVLERADQGGAVAFVDGVPVSLDQVPLPERIVALTITPFDKFPVPRLTAFSVQPADESRYRYLGLRDRVSCPLLSGPSTMTVWIKEGTTNAFEEAQA
jgi:hypothetical protein